MKSFLLLASSLVLFSGFAVANSKEVVKKASNPSAMETKVDGCQKVWTGVVKRVRIYHLPGTSTQKIFVYTGAGTNSDYVGFTDSDTVAKALFESIEKTTAVMGYTDASCAIEWMDYGGV